MPIVGEQVARFDFIDVLGRKRDADDPQQALKQGAQLRVLTALRRGPFGAEHWNAWCAAELGARTIFNILGPLTNPAGVKRQLTGAFSRDLIQPMAQTLQRLGSEAAWLVHGSDGTDEMTITGVTWVAALSGDMITLREIHPEDAGLPVHPFEAIIGGTPEDNADAFRALLGGATGAYRDAVLLNSAAALLVAGAADSLKSGVEMARASIDSGAAKRAVETLARISQEAA